MLYLYIFRLDKETIIYFIFIIFTGLNVQWRGR